MSTDSSVVVSVVSAAAGTVLSVYTVDYVSAVVEAVSVAVDTVSVVAARPTWLARFLIYCSL